MKALKRVEPKVQTVEPEWSFSVLLDRFPTDAEADAMFEAGLDDSTIGDDRVDVARHARSLLAAITSVVSDIRAAGGPRPIGVSFDDSVTLADVALRLNGTRTAESLRLLAAGKRGPGGFPPPRLDTGKIRVYSWAQVSTWLREALGDDVPESDPTLALADAALRLVEWARVVDLTDELTALINA